MSAIFSPCKKYRYVLTRDFHRGGFRPMLFIMLNPSTAGASMDDPTIRRCISFAHRESASGITVVNLFALKATKPLDLVGHINAVGTYNDLYIDTEIKTHTTMPIIVAWGANRVGWGRSQQFLKKFNHINFCCFGTSKDGHPRHPLYVNSNQEIIPYVPQPQ